MNVVSGTLNGKTAANTIETTLEVNDNGTLTLEGTADIVSGGEILLSALQSTATVVVGGSVKISGTGTLVTSNSPNNKIVGTAGKNNALSIGVPIVNFEGTIRDGTTMNVAIGASTTVTNGGYALVLNVGSNHTFYGAIRGLWHAPAIAGGFNYPGHPVSGIALMCIFTTAIGMVQCTLLIRYRSVILTSFLLGAVNSQARGIWPLLFTSVAPQ